MISRYNRRPVSHTLEIRGLSHSSLNHHPPPEEADTPNSPCALQDVEEFIAIRHGSETSCASSPSDCPTVISVASSQSWSGIHSSTGTGVSTERSSVFSWGYDEFDKAASRQVQQMFEEIDKQLYEGEGSGVGILPGLQDECQQWAERFPHLRILGTQLVCPSDEGFQWYEVSSSSSSVSQKSPDKEESSTELNVKGRSAAMQKSNSADPNSSGDRPRVIEAEGHIEEYLAFDSISLEDEWKCSQPCLRPRCMPPVSPYGCRRQAVLDHLFDDVWRQLVGCTRELVQRQWEVHATDDESSSRRLSPPPLFSTLPTMLPKVRQSRAPPLPMLTTGLQFQAGKVQHNLNDLITIHSIPLQQRNLAVLDRTQETDESVPLSLSPVGKPRSRRVLEHSFSSLTRPPQSARRRNLPPRTLQPLAPSLSQYSTMGSMDEIIRGTRLPTASDRLMSPLFALSRNMLLPPIGAGDVGSEQQPKAAQRQKGQSSRAHSAINDEVASSIPRDRLYPLDVFSRPNTTHTYRSDTPYRRSFTLLDNIGQGRPGRASVATDSLGIGVTGVSLGIASSSFLDSFSHHHPLGHWPIRDEELHAPLPAPVGPMSVPPRSHSRGGFSSRLSRPGL
ncbi:protein FAM149B1 isoform X4 [Nerophis ophidion]|uniref:protein FAM149B1 isoform X4 n=1 Tax=Nerophis ophidion TaxID=159077 RepID=UPI002ADF7700|nr:protein FAM149B1 isoform X4 [Nerophis ophidion]